MNIVLFMLYYTGNLWCFKHGGSYLNNNNMLITQKLVVYDQKTSLMNITLVYYSLLQKTLLNENYLPKKILFFV